MKVYEVKVDWATEDDCACRTELYSTEEEAIKAFNAEKLQAMEDYGVFDEQTGELIDEDWQLDEAKYFWEIWEDEYYRSNHCLITLTEKEVL